MKKETLKKLIESYRESLKASNKMQEALELYTDNYVSFSDQALIDFLWWFVEDELWECKMESIYDYITDWYYNVIDWDKVTANEKWEKILKWWSKKNPDKIKEIITDDDRFISYFYDTYETKNPYVITFDWRKVNIDSIDYYWNWDISATANTSYEDEERFRVKWKDKNATLCRWKEHYNTIKESRDYRKDQAEFYEEESRKSWREQGKLKKNNELSEWMVNTACKHMQKDALAIEHLLNIINEVEVLVNEWISKEKIIWVIKNGIERHNLDKMIFTEKLFK